MLRDLIGDTHGRTNENSIVPMYFVADTTAKETGLG